METLTSKPEFCPACNSEIRKIFYQRRAADEPPDEVKFCNSCPLDTNRLSFKFESKTKFKFKPQYSVEKNAIVNNNKTIFPTFTKAYTTVQLIVKGAAALRCYKSTIKAKAIKNTIVAVPIVIHRESKPIKSKYYLTCSSKYEAHVVVSSSTIAPFMSYNIVDVYSTTIDSNQDIENLTKYIEGYEYKLPTVCGSTYTVLTTLIDGQRPYITVNIEDFKDSVILSTIEYILAKYGTELTIKNIITNTTLNMLYIQSGRAYDWPSAPSTGYRYAWKPDGERFWYIRYGSLWLFSRRSLSGKIAGWNICKILRKGESLGPVLDVEVMIGFPPILIDILTSSNGEPMPAGRTLDVVLDEFNFLNDSKNIDIPIHVREYYRSDKDLLQTKHQLEYPVDGVVGVQDRSMTIIKLKDEKSIELELFENGDLRTSDGHTIAHSNLNKSETVGSIIEIRFTKQSTSDKPTITEIFPRTDKVKANDLQACINIVNTISDTPDILARRNAVQWCNLIRQKLNKVAAASKGKGRVILDIGAGDGQSVSDYSTDPEVTYLLVEPSQRKCKSMQRRLQDMEKNNVKYFSSASDTINALRQLSTKKIKYAILCTTLREMLDQKDCLRVLKGCTRCCIACFSISYVVPELEELVIEGLNVIGSGYMYDSVNNNGELVNEYGVLMKYTSYNLPTISVDAIVKWGSDNIYTETAVTTSHFKESFYYKLARNVVPVVADSKSSLLNTISNKVYIVSSNKYII